MANPGVSELITTTLFKQSGEIQDAVINNNALLFLMKKDGLTQSVSGGYEMREPLFYDDNSTAKWYDGYEELDTTPQDVHTALVYQWKQMAGSVIISGKEERMNSGSKEQLFDLIAGRIDNLKTSLANLMDVGLNSDGASAGGKQIGGLNYLFPTSATTGTIGGIARSGNTFVQHGARSTSGVLGVARSASNIKSELNIMMNARVLGTERITDVLMDDTDYNLLLEALQGQQVFEETSLIDASFTAIKYRGANVHLNGGLGGNNPSGTIWGLNRKTLKLKVHSDCNMKALNPDRHSVNQDATVKLVAWMGNLTCKNPRLNFNLYA